MEYHIIYGVQVQTLKSVWIIIQNDFLKKIKNFHIKHLKAETKAMLKTL